MSPRNWKFRLEDINESLDMIFEYTKDLDYDSWKKDRKTIDAVIRNIVIIGEAATHVPEKDSRKIRYSLVSNERDAENSHP